MCNVNVNECATHSLWTNAIKWDSINNKTKKNIYIVYIIYVRVFIFSEENILVHETEKWGGDGDDDDVMWCDISSCHFWKIQTEKGERRRKHCYSNEFASLSSLSTHQSYSNCKSGLILYVVELLLLYYWNGCVRTWQLMSTECTSIVHAFQVFFVCMNSGCNFSCIARNSRNLNNNELWSNKNYKLVLWTNEIRNFSYWTTPIAAAIAG